MSKWAINGRDEDELAEPVAEPVAEPELDERTWPAIPK
jgi:hypothetical protein